MYHPSVSMSIYGMEGVSSIHPFILMKIFHIWIPVHFHQYHVIKSTQLIVHSGQEPILG